MDPTVWVGPEALSHVCHLSGWSVRRVYWSWAYGRLAVFYSMVGGLSARVSLVFWSPVGLGKGFERGAMGQMNNGIDAMLRRHTYS